jgi:hypothetical protein
VVALATSLAWPQLAPDDRLLVAALEKMDLRTEIAIWTDERVQWDRFDLIVVRSCWDYHDDLGRWLGWVDAVERSCGRRRLRNAGAYLRWNARKTYLIDLATRGVPIVPTVWLGPEALASDERLDAALRATPWNDFVVKPAVSAGAFGTYRVRAGQTFAAAAGSTTARLELAPRAPLLIQPFLADISAGGEWSLIFFDGTFSHAVRKYPAPGDFRVQEKHGGRAVAETPPAEVLRVASQTLIAAAEAASMAAEPPPLYARVDVVVSAGRPLVMELEITEPALFLAQGGDRGRPPTAATAADRLALACRAGCGSPTIAKGGNVS